MSIFFSELSITQYIKFSLKCFKHQKVYSNRTGNEKVALKLEGNFTSTEAMDKKQGKPGRKIFRDHIVSFEKGVNQLRSTKLVNALFFSDAWKRLPLIKSFFTRLYCHCDNYMLMEKKFLYLTILLGREHLYLK